MATLSAIELQTVRNYCERSFTGVAYTKPQINAALQAIEDLMINHTIVAGDVGKTIPQLISAAIDVASAPFSFSAAQKKILFALWADLKFNRDK